MGKEQGDGLPEPTYYQHAEFSDLRPAYVAADHVNLKARGWTEVSQDEAPTEESAATADEPQAAVRPAGSQQRERARVVPAPSAAAPADGGNSA